MNNATMPKPAIPAYVKKLLIRGSILFVAWTLLYHLVMKPMGIPDNIFTETVASGTEKFLLLFMNDIQKLGSSIYVNGTRSVNIASQCNGMELIALYIGILLCLPGSVKRKLTFILLGSIGITLLNILRCSALAYMYHQDVPLTDFAHHYAFKLIVYLFAFGGWVLYSRNIKFNEANQ